METIYSKLYTSAHYKDIPFFHIYSLAEKSTPGVKE